jgi:hypothetical protein
MATISGCFQLVTLISFGQQTGRATVAVRAVDGEVVPVTLLVVHIIIIVVVAVVVAPVVVVSCVVVTKSSFTLQ